MELILIVVILLALILWLFSVVRAVSHSNSNNSNSASEGLGERHTVYRSSGSKGFASITYTGDVRYLDGKPIQTTDEFERWRVVNSQAFAIRDHLRFLQQRIVDPSEPKAAQILRRMEAAVQSIQTACCTTQAMEHGCRYK